MFADYVYENSAAKYANKILLIDADHLTENTGFTDGFKSRGFEVVIYHDDLSFRIEYEDKIKSREGRIAVVVNPDQYVPYDLRCRMTAYVVSLSDLFPRLNTAVLREKDPEIYDLVSSAYGYTYDQYLSPAATEQFIRTQAYSQDNIRRNLENSCQDRMHRSTGVLATENGSPLPRRRLGLTAWRSNMILILRQMRSIDAFEIIFWASIGNSLPAWIAKAPYL